MKRVTRRVLDCLCSHGIDPFFAEFGIEKSDVSLFFLNPKNWLHAEDPVWREVMNSLEHRAKDNEALALSCAEICYNSFLHPAHCDLWPNSHMEDRERMQQLENHFEGYMQAFWKAGLRLPNEHKARARLLSGRDEALKKQRSSEAFTSEFIRQIFPLED